jgi:hypothetical protein
MDTEKHELLTSVFICILGLTFLAACGPAKTVPPSASATPLLLAQTTETPFVPLQATLAPLPATATLPCTDGLAFLDDLTIPDNTIVAPGSSLDKQWLVENSGSCNWDSRFRLRLISGDPLGAQVEQALYPARAGTQAQLSILFTAPAEEGVYASEWQAFDPEGNPFGESFVIRIVVSP